MFDLDTIIGENINRLLKEVINENLTLYHGTPHDFIEFQTKNIGTGEGNQSFGWGLYFTDNKGVAEFYAKLLKRESAYVYTAKVGHGNFFEWYKRLDDDFKQSFVSKMQLIGYDSMPFKRILENGKVKALYAPIENAVDYFPNGKFFYENVSLLLGGQKNASKFLYELGFDGIKYPVGSFLKKKWGDVDGYNYVLFDENSVKIVNKEIV